MPDQALLRHVNSLPWFHEMDLGDGIVTPGRTKLPDLRALADVMFAGGVAGKTLLDIGCYDGFFSFEAARRGASRVLATDRFMWEHDTRCHEAFRIARSRVAPGVEDRTIGVDEITADTVGVFDVVLFSGVFYHLRHPFRTLERIASATGETLIVETHVDATDLGRPGMVFYPGRELNDDPTNWWGPNPACVAAMLHDLGFDEVETRPNPTQPTTRAVFKARRGTPARPGGTDAPAGLRREFRSRDAFDAFVAEETAATGTRVTWLEDRAEEEIVEAARRRGVETDFDGRTPPGEVRVIGEEMREHLFAAGVNPRQRALLEMTLEYLRERGITEDAARIYGHEATTPVALKLRGRFPRFVGSEYARDEAARAWLFPIPCADICRLDWPDGAFDLVVSGDVMEHVPSVDDALREAARILRPGGRMVATFPFLHWHDAGVRFAEVRDGEVVHLQAPIYHGNPVDPAGGSLVFELPAWDVLARARSAGFSDARMLLWADRRRGIVGSSLDHPVRPRGVFVGMFDR